MPINPTRRFAVKRNNCVRENFLRTTTSPRWLRRRTILLIDEWLAAAKLKGGVIFRAIRKNGKVWGSGLDESAIWEIVRHYAALVGHPNFAPHDARRTCARIYYDAKAPLK
jgi:integrase